MARFSGAIFGAENMENENELKNVVFIYRNV